MKKLLVIVLGLCLLGAVAARAQMELFNLGVAGGGASSTYVGPGDKVAGATFWGGLRAYSAATVNTKSANICNASDVNCADINTTFAGNFDVTTAQAAPLNCSSGSCTIKTIYDKIGTNDVTQATISKRPTLIFNCIGSLPCAQFSQTNAQILVAGSNTAIAQPYTMVVAAKRITGTTTDMNAFTNGGGPLIDFYQISGDLKCAANTSIFPTGVAEASFHAIQFIANGASSNCHWDTTDFTGNAGTISATSKWSVGGPSSGVGNFTGQALEFGAWSSGFSGTNLSDMNTNIKNYWGY